MTHQKSELDKKWHKNNKIDTVVTLSFDFTRKWIAIRHFAEQILCGIEPIRTLCRSGSVYRYCSIWFQFWFDVANNIASALMPSLRILGTSQGTNRCSDLRFHLWCDLTNKVTSVLMQHLRIIWTGWELFWGGRRSNRDYIWKNFIKLTERKNTQ